MPFDSQGNFTRIHNWEEDRQNDIEIVSSRHDEEDDNFATGLSQCMLRSGNAVMQDNLNMGNFQINNVTSGTASTDAVNKGQMDTALSGKQNTVTGAASTIVSSNLTANRALASDVNGKVAAIGVTLGELSYLSGVTSAIQTQLNNRITASISKASSGALKLSNGLIINWGRKTFASPDPQTATFTEQFTSTNYKVVGTYYRSDQVGSGFDQVTITEQNKGNFKFYMTNTSNVSVNWIAIGY